MSGEYEGPQPGRAARTARVVGGTVAMLAVLGAVAVGVVQFTGRSSPTPATAQVPTGSAEVTRGTVTERVRVSGTLGYDGSYPVAHHGSDGIVTWLPATEATIGRGDVLYRVANEPVRLLYGDVPAYRDFKSGMSNGPDVRELENNLSALGYAPGTVDDHFSSSTAAAIRRWQATWGWASSARTGALPMGSVAFVPVEMRVAQLNTAVGAMLGSGAPVLSGTSTQRVISAQVSIDQAVMVHPNDTVQVLVTGSAPVSGKVLRVGTIATSSQASSGQSSQLTVTVTIQATLQGSASPLDQAPVLVNITSAVHEDVLMVPVSALLARSGGGYQVRLIDGGYVEVQPGLFDDSASTVEVTGNLTVGQRVEVPSS